MLMLPYTGTAEYEVVGPTATEEFEAQYTDCHTHGSSTWVMIFTTAQLAWLIFAVTVSTLQAMMSRSLSKVQRLQKARTNMPMKAKPKRAMQMKNYIATSMQVSRE
ncbi:high-affinity Zn(2+) transporter zrt1 [Didymosphaeria variabile]|uniref:High-affinity Zn(2+) transporter zrt1 n=1 Tax=Didymosphaeria variabile TaxID=1932322 RepID=A0A9W9C9C3_9PLEO|nr:high-affinity Zn(2+) transporter zrt1 [Didymosphaeria variabile]KAJ4351939.1 high-affinity Zn(2+) transporter zrt1 [Didymosphaeria variabile]